MSLRHPKSVAVAIAAIALSATSAVAGESGDQPSAAATETHTPAVGPGDGSSTPEMLSLEELAETRGRATIVINNQTLAAITSGNQLGSYVAGTINLSDNALSSFSGVGNFLFNTGAQNSLQTGMTLTITIE
jgi:hypothetical protein